ncbi:MAG: asparagine synthase (glutamine-hydrolyzing) [Pirellulales bacterium]
MCGIAGIIDLRGQREIDQPTLKSMADAIEHRGPDEEGFYCDVGVGLASRRLSIVGLADGQQPIFNEDGSVVVVFNGELFDHVEQRALLESQGHRFRTHADTEVLVHMWEQYGEEMLELIDGQYAFVLYDIKQRTLLMARDRIGICPLHWARRGDMFYFGSEIKAILASGEVTPEADPRGLDHIFTFFATGTRRTAFRDVQSVPPGCCLKIRLGAAEHSADVRERRYWELNFPDAGDEYEPDDPRQLEDEFEETLKQAVAVRLRADVPVVGYLSGGVDSTTVMLTASKLKGEPVPPFTVQIPDAGFDETDRALMAAERLGRRPTVARCTSERLSAAYPKLIEAAEGPVVDTACSAMYCLAGEVHSQGYKVALTGEGADEWLAGYPWFKYAKLLRALDNRFFTPSDWILRQGLRRNCPDASWAKFSALQKSFGSINGFGLLYGLVGLTRERFYSEDMWRDIGDHTAWDDLELNFQAMKRWHPLNRSLYVGHKTILCGLLLNHKGDRPAMNNSVETRYPFLDLNVINLCRKVHPRWKLRGLRGDKYLLRRYATKLLPDAIAKRPKSMFRAPFANTFFANPPDYVEQLMSEESLRATGYFDANQVRQQREVYEQYKWHEPGRRLVAEMGLTAVMTTQLWHHIYLGDSLCELPQWSASAASAASDAPVQLR